MRALSGVSGSWVMKGKFFLGSLAFAVLVLAVGGWTVRGVRWAAAAPVRAFA